MATFNVINYKISKKKDENDYEYTEVDLNLKNNKGERVSKIYGISTDTNFSKHEHIENKLSRGFDLAIERNQKIEISKFHERFYITFGIPSADSAKEYPRFTWRNESTRVKQADAKKRV